MGVWCVLVVEIWLISYYIFKILLFWNYFDILDDTFNNGKTFFPPTVHPLAMVIILCRASSKQCTMFVHNHRKPRNTCESSFAGSRSTGVVGRNKFRHKTTAATMMECHLTSLLLPPGEKRITDISPAALPIKMWHSGSRGRRTQCCWFMRVAGGNWVKLVPVEHVPNTQTMCDFLLIVQQQQLAGKSIFWYLYANLCCSFTAAFTSFSPLVSWKQRGKLLPLKSSLLR